MKRTIPFTKTITFRTMIAEITDIEVKHNLELKEDDEIEGDILVDGTYKMTDASQIEEEFHYKLPFAIELDPKYDTKNMEIVIGDFYFEIINEEDLKINVEIDIDGLEEKVVPQEIVTSKISLDNQEIVEETYSQMIKDKLKEILIWVAYIVGAILLAFLITKFGLERTPMDDVSMEPTLNRDDKIIINKFNYIFTDPKRFDIIVKNQSIETILI